jgi:transposase-like protein
VATKHFANKALRAWWSTHVEAWQRSGLSQRAYCRRHHLTETTFVRWRKLFVDEKALRAEAELAREERLERRRRNGRPVSKDKRCRAVQAYWAMHVEAMNWSGMSVREYAVALRLSERSLRRWRDLLDHGEVSIDWRAVLHPSARPQISTSLSTNAKEVSPESRLTNLGTAEPPLDGRSHRRRFSAEEKMAIVLETERPGVTVSQVARNHRIVSSVLFRWRAELGFGKDKAVSLATVELSDGRSSARPTPVIIRDLLQPPDGTTVFDLGNGQQVFAPVGSDPEAIRRHVADKQATP